MAHKTYPGTAVGKMMLFAEDSEGNPVPVKISQLGGGGGGPVNWDDIQDKPTSFPPSSHTHSISDVSGLQNALDGKANTSHTHNISDISGLQAALDNLQAQIDDLKNGNGGES